MEAGDESSVSVGGYVVVAFAGRGDTDEASGGPTAKAVVRSAIDAGSMRERYDVLGDGQGRVLQRGTREDAPVRPWHQASANAGPRSRRSGQFPRSTKSKLISSKYMLK